MSGPLPDSGMDHWIEMTKNLVLLKCILVCGEFLLWTMSLRVNIKCKTGSGRNNNSDFLNSLSETGVTNKWEKRWTNCTNSLQRDELAHISPFGVTHRAPLYSVTPYFVLHSALAVRQMRTNSSPFFTWYMGSYPVLGRVQTETHVWKWILHFRKIFYAKGDDSWRKAFPSWLCSIFSLNFVVLDIQINSQVDLCSAHRVLRCALSKRTWEEMGSKWGTCTVGADGCLGQHAES